MKNIANEILAGITVFLGSLTLWRAVKKDVPESTKDFVRDEIDEHKMKEDTERKERAKSYQFELTQKVEKTITVCLESYDKNRRELQEASDNLLKKDVRFLSSQFKDLHEDVKTIRDNCDFHRRKK